jgi:hypothetical protein
MPVRTKDGLVHRVAAREGVDYKGILGCGMLYRRDAKSRTKWVPHGVPTMSARVRSSPFARARRRHACGVSPEGSVDVF